MTLDLHHFTPALSLAGGLIIGVAASVLILFNGRIAGISGILGGLLSWPRNDRHWRIAFLAGLIASPLLAGVLGYATAPQIDASWNTVLLAGFIVGLGTRYAGGCTSGHGVCGMSRGAVRSIVATLTFMAAGFITVYLQRHLLGA